MECPTLNHCWVCATSSRNTCVWTKPPNQANCVIGGMTAEFGDSCVVAGMVEMEDSGNCPIIDPICGSVFGEFTAEAPVESAQSGTTGFLCTTDYIIVSTILILSF